MGRNHSIGLNIEDVDSRPLNHMEVDRSLATTGQFLQEDNSKQWLPVGQESVVKSIDLLNVLRKAGSQYR
ncbi:hypothetical protein Ancab_033623, partial [Ancistrocladus abbreviatus]